MKILLTLLAVFFFSISARAQLLENGGFETLTETQNDTIPDNWYIHIFGAGITNDAYSGKNATYIWNWYYYGKGYLVNGGGGDGIQGGRPVTSRPSKLTGYYKYIFGENGGSIDTAQAIVYLFKYNAAKYDRDTLAFGSAHLTASDTYIPFSANIEYFSEEQPDSILVCFISSISGFCTSETGTCCFLYLDDISVTSTSGTEEEVNFDTGFSLYPNPSDGSISISGIDSFPADFSAYDMTGNLVWKSTISDKTRVFTGLRPGTYLCEARLRNNEIVRQKLIIR